MWSITHNEDGTKSVMLNDKLVGVYMDVRGRWAGVLMDGTMLWGATESEVYEHIIDGVEANV